jgi:UDP-N-acetylmuramate--alanine ligase
MKRRVHLVGIGGAGLSAIARILHERGDIVTGSDLVVSPYSTQLEQIGVSVTYGHQAENIGLADLVLASSAVPDSNTELEAARRAGIPVMRRPAFLGELTSGYQTIAIAGTHGKTTTTGLIAWLLDGAGLSPSFIVGGLLLDYGTNARAGRGPYFVIEADEYDRTFLGLQPRVAVVTSVEHDHPDIFPTLADVQRAFEAFSRQVEDMLVVCLENPGAAALMPEGISRLTYGFDPEAIWRAEEIRPNPAGGSDFLVLFQGETLGLVRTRLPGVHNVLNSLAALAVVDYIGVEFKIARDLLVSFRGLSRRFEVVGEVGGVTVIDDYAHHPTEVQATLRAARQRYPDATLWAVFQPHTYSRARALLDDFAKAFTEADHVIVTEIFASRERSDASISGKIIADRIEHGDVKFLSSLTEATEELLQRVRAGSVVVTLSAGDGDQVGRRLLQVMAANQGDVRHE